jgi:thymidylate synthase (FAD)
LGGVSRIAEEAGVSYHTIRKWLKKHNLTFSREEVSKYTTVWNKGLPKEKQPMFGKVMSEETREKMSKSARSGEDSNLYIDGRSKNRSWNQKVWDWQFTQKRKLQIETGKYCKSCGETENLEIDHKLPKNQHPELAFDYNNLQFLCKPCHREKTTLENQTVTWSKIKSITYIGEEQTYDMEVDHESHNYVANGIITHNSQRYAEVQECETYSARRQDEKNRQNSIDDLENEAKTWFDVAQQRVHDEAQKLYNETLELGIAKEQARFLLPMSASTTLYMTGSVRSWIHYLKTRLANGTQQEHIEIAEQIAEIFKEQFPNVYKAAFGGE